MFDAVTAPRWRILQLPGNRTSDWTAPRHSGPTRRGEHPVEHLRGFAGIPQADAYAGYIRLYEPGRSAWKSALHCGTYT